MLTDAALRRAAARVGLGPNEYIDRTNSGLRYCTACLDWHPAGKFGADRSRMDGLTTICREARRNRRKARR